ncbi:MAG: peroxiredoxin family protein [Hyphomonadaceae bacterium]
MIAATLAMTGVGAVSQAAPALAEAPMEFGMKVGETVPAIEGTTQDGRPADFASLNGEHGMVLAFFRSADWCPFCKKQLEDLNTVAPQLAAAGYPLVALSYDPVETLKRFSEKKALTYTLLSDPDSKSHRRFRRPQRGSARQQALQRHSPPGHLRHLRYRRDRGAIF